MKPSHRRLGLRAHLVLCALQRALKHRRTSRGMLHPSDRDAQYASERPRAQLSAHRITVSMSRRGNCYDNARAEAFFSTLKIKLVYRDDLHAYDHARQVVFEWIEAFYNRRSHSSIGYRSPVDFENQKT